MTDTEPDDAVAQAVRLLSQSRAPVIAGLQADVAGIVAAFRLARKLGAVVDHASAEWSLRDQAVLQDAGFMLTTPGVARQRADTILLVGDRPLAIWPELLTFLLADRPRGTSPDAKERRIVALSSRTPEAMIKSATSWLKADKATLPGLLAALRASVNGRPLAQGFEHVADVNQAAGILQEAGFGVALWCADEIDTLTIEMLSGLVKDLNAKTRWSGLSIAQDASAPAAMMGSGWISGLPLRISFAGERALHDPWQFDARRLVEAGEADAVVWISAFGESPPDWLGDVPAIVVAAEGRSKPKDRSTIVIPVGRPGQDHDGILFDRATGTLVESLAQSATDLPSVADALTRIADRVSPL